METDIIQNPDLNKVCFWSTPPNKACGLHKIYKVKKKRFENNVCAINNLHNTTAPTI